MRSLKLGFLYFTTLIRKRKKQIFLLSFFVLTLFLSIYLWRDFFLKPKLTQGLIGTYLERDLPDTFNNLLSQSLIKVEKNGIPKPNLITSWEIKENGKVYILHLKDYLFWSDGTLIKSAEIDFGIPGIEAKYPDNKTIEISLVDSFSPFPTLLTKPIFKKGTEKLGLGPYVLKGYQKDQIFIKKAFLSPLKKDLPELVIRFYPNEKIAKNAFNLGEVSSVFGISDLEGLRNEKTILVDSKTNYQQLVTIFYNTKDPILSDENFRQALSYAAPSVPSEFKAITSLPQNSWAFNEDVKKYLDSPEQAAAALSKVKNGRESIITLTATSSLKEVGDMVVESWKKNGIKAVLRAESGIPQNFQALLIAQNIPVDPDQYSLWHSTQSKTNISKISSPRIDKDLEDGRKSTDPETRSARYLDFQKVLLDESPATFLFFPRYNFVYREKAKKSLEKVVPIQFPRFFE